MQTNPYQVFATSFQSLIEQAKSLPFGGMEAPPKVECPENAPVALIMSPHPDDECIIGGLALRLMRESGFRIVNVAVTLGSNQERRQARLEELQGACEWIGFHLQETASGGLEKVTVHTRETNSTLWQTNQNCLEEIVTQWSPSIIFLPHAQDWNGTHIGVHHLTMDALRNLNSFETTLIETEYWGQMSQPNLMVENTPEQVADLLAALSHHEGELTRNAFHIGLPSWMHDNVRRGAELVGGQGGPAPDFTFATLYRVLRWTNQGAVPAWDQGKRLPASESHPMDIIGT